MNLIRGYGIYLYDAHSNNISDNSISNSTYRGIYMGESNRNNITGNDITLSDDYGIWLGECNSNNISGNIISNNNYGMYLWYSDNNIVSANNIDSNRALGMYLYAFSDSNNISENVISNNDDGIWSFYSNYNIISNNTISSNVEFGTYFYTFNTNNIIEGNTITSSKTGVHIRDASDNNTFYHNIFINNTQNAVDECSNNWDNGTKGNYWDDYPGIDADGDGIGDIPYNISGGNNQDRYPLGFFPPFANFTFAPENPKKHEDIYFYDTSYDPDSTIVSWWWDFDDGFYSDLQNPIHRYIEDGIYNVSLIVSDELGKNDTIIKTIVVYTPNVPPNPPIISGPASGNAGTSYSYTFISADQNGDNVSYYIEWGDGNITNWTAFQASGLPGYSENHTWSSQGAYTIRAKTKDIFDVESEWTILEVTMPKNKATTTNSVIIKNIKNRHVKS